MPLGLAVAALLAAAGLASHGRPLSGSRGSGPTSQFFDYLLTTLLIGGIVLVLVLIYALLQAKPSADPAGPPPRKANFIASFLTVVVASLFSWYLVHAHLTRHLTVSPQPTPAPHSKGGAHAGAAPLRSAKHVGLQWDELIISTILIGGVVVGVLVTRRRRPLRPPWMLRSQEEVSAALEESLDDLRSEPDLRKAIIAAYARMEGALGVAGIRRRPSEAPFEYLTRALTSLDASADASRRLTDLFEWAKFSQHAPVPSMRDDAIAALVAVRDELRNPTTVPA